MSLCSPGSQADARPDSAQSAQSPANAFILFLFFIDASRCLDQKTQTKVGGLPRTIEMEIRRHLYMHREQSKSAPGDQATTSRMARIHRLGSRAAR